MSGSRPRALFVLRPGAPHGGIQDVVRRLAVGLPAYGFDVTVVLAGDPPAAVVERFDRDGIDLRVDAAMGSKAPLARFRAWRRCMREHRASIVVPHYGEPILRLLDVYAARVGGAVVAPVLHSGASVRIGVGGRIAFRLVGGVGVVSSVHAAALHAAGAPPSHVHVLVNGVDPVADPPTRDAARRDLGVPEDGFVVGMVARLVANKGVATLVESCGRIEDRRVHLVVAGDGPQRAIAEHRAASLLPGRARFLGWREDVATVYAAIDVLAIPSLEEAVPLVALEAAGYGVPTVGSGVGAVHEAVIDGVTGMLVPSNDVEGLAVALRRLLDDADLRASLGRAARERVSRDLTGAAMLESHAGFLTTVLERRRA